MSTTTTAPITPDDFSERIKSAAEQLAKPVFHDALDDCAEVVAQQYKTQFDLEESPTRQPWEPWQWRPAVAPPDHPTGFITGRLKFSLAGDTPDTVEENDGRSLRKGTNVPYAEKFHAGGEEITDVTLLSRGGRVKPAGSKINIIPRPTFGLNENTIGECTEIVADAALDVVLESL